MTNPLSTRAALQESEDNECAKFLIELAFLLPRGTDCQTHSACVQLKQYVAAVRANAKNI